MFVKRNFKVCLVSLAALIIIFSLATWFVVQTQKSYEQELHSRKLADDYRQRADFVAEQYKEERNESQRLLRRLSQQFAEEVDMMTKVLIFNQPVRSINQALEKIEKTLELEPDNILFQSKYVYCLFLIQDFQGVIDNYKPEHGVNEDLFTLSQKYVSQLNEEGLLPIAKLAELILHFPKVRRSHLVEKMLAYDEQKRSGEHDYSAVVKAILKVWNPGWNMTGFKYQPTKDKVVVSNLNLKILTYKPISSSNHSVLRFLRFKALNLEGSGLYDLSQIQDLEVNFLNIMRTPVNDLAPLNKMKNLRYLWVKENQFSPQELSNVPSYIKVVIKK